MRISSRRLGELLVSRHVLSRDSLDELLARGSAEGVHLGTILQLEQVVSEDDLMAAVASELGVPVDDLAEQMYGSDGDGDGGPWADELVRAEGEPQASPSAPAGAVKLDDLLDEVMRAGGSDLHLTVGSPPVVRVQGELRRMPGLPALNGSQVRRLVLGLFTHSQRERFLSIGELSTSHAIPGKGRFRVSAFVQRDSIGAVLRLVPAEIPTAEDLGLPDGVIEWADHRRGLVLVCGPHGSGMSTTLAALVDRINRSRAAHILTIEEPIEFLHRHRAGIVNQREVGEDTVSFESGLRYALRQDPDVLVAGELPDIESIRLALAAAETGHLVLATLRTIGAVQTIERVVDVFPLDQQQQVRVQLATTLRGIVVQQLVPALDGGRALATEVLLPTPQVVECIRSGDSGNLSKAILGGATSGMGTMDQSLAELVQEGIIDIEVAIDRALDPTELQYLLSGQTH